MPYQIDFNPGEKFYTYVHPFISKLPKYPGDTPLTLKIDIHQANSCRYQWYNYINHFHKGLFRTKLHISKETNTAWLSISRIAAATTPSIDNSLPSILPSPVPVSAEHRDESIQALADKIASDLKLSTSAEPATENDSCIQNLQFDTKERQADCE